MKTVDGRPASLSGVLLTVFLTLAPAVCGQTRRGATLAEQKACSEQAQQYGAADVIVVNHYNKSRNICFVRTFRQVFDEQNNKKFAGSDSLLWDAFEHTLYGDCITEADKTVLECWAIQPSNKGKKSFTTTDAWMQYVGQTYMSD